MSNQLRPCNYEVYKYGTILGRVANISDAQMEMWIRHIIGISQERVDWHYYDSQPVVKVLGDTETVQKVLEIIRSNINKLPEESIWKED